MFREHALAIDILPLADHSGLLFRLAAPRAALLEVALHLDLEAALLGALLLELGVFLRGVS